VIANPPYVSYYSRESARTEEADKEINILRRQFTFTNYENKTGRLNLWMFFVEKFVKLLREKGVSAFIVDVNFTKNLAKNIRKYLLEHTSIKQFIYDLSEFEHVASGQVILIIQKGQLKNGIYLKKSLADKGTKIQQNEVKGPDYDLLILYDDPIVIKLSSIAKLGDIPELKLTTGIQISGVEFYKGKQVKDYFYRPKWDYKTVFPSIKVKSVQRYSRPKLEKGVLFDYQLASKITKNTKKSAVVLNKFKEFLDREKIYIRQSAAQILATMGQPKTCAEYSIFSLISYSKNLNLKYILALLNSKLFTYFAIKKGIILSKKGTQPQIRKAGLEKLPIKELSLGKQKVFINLVDRIFAISKDDDYLRNEAKQKRVKEYEHQIDKMVYKLYGLTNEEIKIVEINSK